MHNDNDANDKWSSTHNTSDNAYYTIMMITMLVMLILRWTALQDVAQWPWKG